MRVPVRRHRASFGEPAVCVPPTRILACLEAPMARVLNSAVARMHALAGAAEREVLPLR